MATAQYASSTEYSDYATSYGIYRSVDSINTKAREYIPRYSIINSVVAKADMKRGGINISTSNTDAKIYFYNEISAIKGLEVGSWSNEVTTSYKTFSADITKYCFSKTSEAGAISSSAINNYSRLYYSSEGLTLRNHYIKNIGVYWDYTPPTFTISVKSNGNGSVSGGGTFNVTVADQTKTITATPNTGYKFVKWTDSNGKTYTTASLNVTISQNSISAHSTSVTYTATFEPISYTVTVTAGTGGTVSGGGTYTQGSTATLKATPNSGYKFVKWNDGNTSNPRTVTVSGNATYTATFEKDVHTVTFKNQDGTTVKTSQIQSGSTLGTLPTVSRSGYTFIGWIPCAPAKKIDNTVLDSCYYNGSVAYPLLQSYKYTNNLSMHIEVYMGDWMDIKNNTRQIMSCTESGGWGFGYQANSKVDGAEAHGFEVNTGSYTGYDLKFGTSGEYTNNKWYSFDITFSNGVIEIFVDGVSKGSRTASGTTVKYNSSNTIFVGGEAKGDTSSAQNYFKGFISNVFIANQSTRLQIATTSTVVNKNIEYYPVWRINTTRTATFKNYDGTVLQTLQVEYGRTPSYTGSTPTRATTAEYTYTFSGWNPSVGAITSNTEYVAQFTATKRKYTITASGTNGSVSGGGSYEYNSSVTLTATPNTGYKFIKWSDGILNATRTIYVTRDETYTAYFGINRVLADNSKAKNIMLNLDKVKALLLHNTKVYES